jgi:hypothetical protein
MLPRHPVILKDICSKIFLRTRATISYKLYPITDLDLRKGMFSNKKVLPGIFAYLSSLAPTTLRFLGISMLISNKNGNPHAYNTHLSHVSVG